MTRAEQKVLEKYPKRYGGSPYGPLPIELNINERQLFMDGYEQRHEQAIRAIIDELNRRLNMYSGLSPETISPARIDEVRSILKFLDTLEKE